MYHAKERLWCSASCKKALKKKMQEDPGYPRSLTQKEMEEILEEGFTKVMEKKWDDKSS